MDPPALEHAFDYVARLKPAVWFGEGPSGARMFREITGGTVEGPLLRGEVLSGGGDWATIGADGFLADSSDGGETAFDDQYWRIAPRFETGDERYAWLAQSTFVARGRIHPEGVAYEVFVVR
jgi:Protein of unknown function (DUF3237)